jgi:methionyl aminopeptidase
MTETNFTPTKVDQAALEDMTEHEKYLLSGKIAKEILDHVEVLVKPGVTAKELCLVADNMVFDSGAMPAFPLNVSVNHHAAHYTAGLDDTLVISNSDVVKIDLGIQVDGYIADTAKTVIFNDEFEQLVSASKEATMNALNSIIPGMNTKELGAMTEKTIKDHGYLPISDLSGHLLERYVLHGDKTVPCIANARGSDVEEGDVFAIETFASTGSGKCHHDRSKVLIFRVPEQRLRLRSPAARKIASITKTDYSGLPFAERWLLRHNLKASQVKMGMRELKNNIEFIQYPVLTDQPESFVSQHEHTVIVTADGPIITTI